MEQTIQVNWEGKEVDITLRSLTYGEYKKIRRKSVIDRTVNGKTEQFRDMDLYDELFMITSIKNAPFEKTISNLGKLDISDGKKVERAVEELNFPEDGA